jgi:hypothetical protein
LEVTGWASVFIFQIVSFLRSVFLPFGVKFVFLFVGDFSFDGGGHSFASLTTLVDGVEPGIQILGFGAAVPSFWVEESLSHFSYRV